MSEEPTQELQAVSTASAVEADDAATPLLGTGLLDPEEAGQLLARSPGRVVVWMGERDSGKTTLTARLYERQRYAGEDVRFAGSSTLLAFEALTYRRHLAAGGRSAPPAQSLRAGDAHQIYHLALTYDAERLNLLVADLPGELFRAVADNQLALSSIPLVRRADKLALIVDGARLRDPGERASVSTRVRQLLERLAADSLPHAGTELALVVTKWDLIADWQAREHQLAASVRELHAEAEHVRVAAGAPASFPQDDGVGALRSWLLAAPGTTPDPPVEPYEWPEDAPERMRKPWRRGT
jgi:nicotinamide riboside kinase